MIKLTSYTAHTRRGPKTVQSPYTNNEAIERLSRVEGNFAADLRQQHDDHIAGRRRSRPLSNNQWAWVHILCVEADQKEQGSAGIDIGKIDGIIALFDQAREHLKWPKVRLRTTDGTLLRLSVAGPNAKFPGSINVCKEAENVDREWIGRVHTDGTWQPTNNGQADEIAQALREFAENPAKVAAEYGKLMGHCCFCLAELTDERSLIEGYGPKCASNYNLPWGNKRR